MSIKLAQKERQAIGELLAGQIDTREALHTAKRRLAKKYGLPMIKNSEIIGFLPTRPNGDSSRLKKVLRKRAVRTLSGIAPVAVLTKPWPCPGKCVYCPSERDVPQSYLSNEPAVMRAIRAGYDPYDQVQSRLRALVANGHEPTKIELIVIGGTWSVLPEEYKYWYILSCFAAANNFQFPISNFQKNSKSQITKLANKNIDIIRKQLFKEQKRNEKAKYKIIGITLETRPDYINEKELLEMRELGCTRVELGVQAVDEKILKLNRRGHGVQKITEATKCLKDFGFKVTYHIMPALPGSTPARDLKVFESLFSDERFQPDQIKFYPTVVTRGSLLYRWWREGKYGPYPQKILEKLIADCKAVVPPYVRIIRLIRDIPGESIVAGNTVTNLRQVMQRRGVKCSCIRCREVKGGKIDRYALRVMRYASSGGEEYFIEATSRDGKTLYGFCRLRLRSHSAEHARPLRFAKRFGRGTHNVLNEAALIRELHVYGELVPVGKKKRVQHAGLGKKLMAEAEKIARQKGFLKIAVISGVGVRGYYRKLGYRLKNSYMVK